MVSSPPSTLPLPPPNVMASALRSQAPTRPRAQPACGKSVMSYAAAARQHLDDGRGQQHVAPSAPTKTLRWSGLDSTPTSIDSRLEAPRPPLATSTTTFIERGRSSSALPAPPPSAGLAAPQKAASLASRAVPSLRTAASARPSTHPSGATTAATRSPVSPNPPPRPLSPNAGRGRPPVRGPGARGRGEGSWRRFYDATREQRRRELAAEQAYALRQALASLARAPDPMRV